MFIYKMVISMLDVILTILAISLICGFLVLFFLGLDYLNEKLQKKKREEYFSNIKQCIVEALTTLENR